MCFLPFFFYSKSKEFLGGAFHSYKFPEISSEESSGTGIFRNESFGILGLSLEVVLTFQKIGKTGRFRSIRSVIKFLLGSRASSTKVDFMRYFGLRRKFVNGADLFSSGLRLTGKYCSIRQSGKRTACIQIMPRI